MYTRLNEDNIMNSGTRRALTKSIINASQNDQSLQFSTLIQRKQINHGRLPTPLHPFYDPPFTTIHLQPAKPEWLVRLLTILPFKIHHGSKPSRPAPPEAGSNRCDESTHHYLRIAGWSGSGICPSSYIYTRMSRP